MAFDCFVIVLQKEPKGKREERGGENRKKGKGQNGRQWKKTAITRAVNDDQGL